MEEGERGNGHKHTQEVLSEHQKIGGVYCEDDQALAQITQIVEFPSLELYKSYLSTVLVNWL